MTSTVKILTAPLISLSVLTSEVFRLVEEGNYNIRPKFLLGTSDHSRISEHDSGRLVSKSFSDQEDTYTHVTNTGIKIDAATTGVKAFRGEGGGECFYCRMEYDYLGLGICTRIESSGEDITYYVEDRCICRPQCLISYLGYIHIPSRMREEIEHNTLSMLRSIYGQDYIPVGSNDFRLLKKNRGSLTHKEWLDEVYDSSQVRTVKIIPMKSEYLAQR